jgi:hypothetical protein
MSSKPFSIAKTAAAVLECAEVRAQARNIQDDPDLTNFEHLLIETGVGGQERVDIPKGPSQARAENTEKKVASQQKEHPGPDWAALEPSPRSVQQMLDADQEEDLDDGVDWDSELAGSVGSDQPEDVK